MELVAFEVVIKIARHEALAHAVGAVGGRPKEALMRLVTSPALIAAILMGLAATAWAQIPTVDIDKTCQAAAGVTISLLGTSTTEQDVKLCLDSERKAREQIIKDHATYSSADKKQCIRSDVYLPSYVEWLTCLEMEKHVRELRREQPPATDTFTLPRARRAINY
jgi:hypothetical protein